MSNKLRRAVEEYLEDDAEYARSVEAELQALTRQARSARVLALRGVIAATYWRAGEVALYTRSVNPQCSELIERLAMEMEAAL